MPGAGEYYRAGRGAIELERIYEDIKRLEKRQIEAREVDLYHDRYQWFAGAALLLLALESMLLGDPPAEPGAPGRARREGGLMRPGGTMTLSRRNSAGVALLLAVFLLSFAGSWTDLFRSVPERAEQAYKAKNYQQALEYYQEALTRNPDSDTLAYNLGNTQYQLGQYQEAAGQFGRVLSKQSPTVGPRALYNMGNSLFQMGREQQDQQLLNQSLEAFKKSIRLNPRDEDAKHNYELVKRFIQQQQQQQQQPNQDQNKQDQQQQQQKQDQKQQDQDQQPQQQPRPQDQQQQEGKQPPPPQPGQMTKEEAERILEALMRMEKQMQEQEQDRKARAVKRGPDW